MIVLNFLRGNSGLVNKVCSIVVVKGLDVNYYLIWNLGLIWWFVWVVVFLFVLKCLVVLRFVNIIFCVSYFVFLVGDI